MEVSITSTDGEHVALKDASHFAGYRGDASAPTNILLKNNGIHIDIVIDASTGQNGLVQAKQFADAVDVTGIVLTKLDGTAKGGIVLAIQAELGIPVKVVGVGEGIGDLIEFDPEEFAAALFGDS